MNSVFDKGYNLVGCCRASDGIRMSSKNPRDTENKSKSRDLEYKSIKSLHYIEDIAWA